MNSCTPGNHVMSPYVIRCGGELLINPYTEALPDGPIKGWKCAVCGKKLEELPEAQQMYARMPFVPFEWCRLLKAQHE
jgi:hypothetical protein